MIYNGTAMNITSGSSATEQPRQEASAFDMRKESSENGSQGQHVVTGKDESEVAGLSPAPTAFTKRKPGPSGRFLIHPGELVEPGADPGKVLFDKDQGDRKRDGRKRGITWGQYLGRPECPYLRRWVLNAGKFSIRLHHWMGSDDDRFFHDHPWWFRTFVFKGGYTDMNPLGFDKVRAPAYRYRPARHSHTVQVDEGGAWTLMLTGPEFRRWGFWVNGKFKPSWRYFFDHGHHQCDV